MYDSFVHKRVNGLSSIPLLKALSGEVEGCYRAIIVRISMWLSLLEYVLLNRCVDCPVMDTDDLLNNAP